MLSRRGTLENQLLRHYAAFAPAQLLQTSQKRRDFDACLRITLGNLDEHAYASHPLALLRARRERPRGRAAEQRDELAPFHSITSSAIARSLSGISRLSAFAVPRLITNSNLVGCMTGRLAGFSPLRMRPAYTPT